MGHINVEIKAKCENLKSIRNILKSRHADFIGMDHQIDTYFNVNHGRLKLREGNIENYLIYYDRSDQKGPKKSDIILFKSNPKSTLKEILTNSLGILTVVDKEREIYFVDNVKFHVDNVKGLGSFIEIEAIGNEGETKTEHLLKQCNFYLDLFKIPNEDLISNSYGDLLKNES